jgi:N-acetylglucosaminyldiphosphoundecaprenol N-acetyl-beta-D-mannosaminyltransferase
MKILGVPVQPTSYPAAIAQIMAWAEKNESRYVCAANVHMVMEAHDSPEYMKVVNQADLVTPDGMPLVWAMRRLGFPKQERVYGPDLAIQLIDAAAKNSMPIGFYGSSAEVLEHLVNKIRKEYPSVKIAYSFSPPFRPTSREEDAQIIHEINGSGARILLVGLGCPKQEEWMSQHKDKIKVVMIGVGAAFDFHAGVKPQAPAWMQNRGLEWLYRLIHEPRRLWKRYLYHNPRFTILVLSQIFLWNPSPEKNIKHEGH